MFFSLKLVTKYQFLNTVAIIDHNKKQPFIKAAILFLPNNQSLSLKIVRII